MACGFGACYGCAVCIDGELKRLCVEGPVLEARRVLADASPIGLATGFSGGIQLDNPLINGSGTLDALLAGTLGLGAFVSKTVTLNPREGNPPPRIAETPSGMINSIGLANPGVEGFCDHTLPRLAELGPPLIVSVGGWSPHEYAVAVARIAENPSVRAIELNVSCPNVESGCISIGTDAAETERWSNVAAARPTCRCSSSSPRTWPTSARSPKPLPTAERRVLWS